MPTCGRCYQGEPDYPETLCEKCLAEVETCPVCDGGPGNDNKCACPDEPREAVSDA